MYLSIYLTTQLLDYLATHLPIYLTVHQAMSMTAQLEGSYDPISLDWTVANTSFYLEKHLIEFHQSFYICASISLPKHLCIKLSAYLSIYLYMQVRACPSNLPSMYRSRHLPKPRTKSH